MKTNDRLIIYIIGKILLQYSGVLLIAK